YLSEGSKIDLSYMAHKKDWTFAGWNTNKDATLGLSTIEMSNADVTLYAIYKKTINVSYTKGTGISAIGKTTDSCVMYNKATSCQITLPSITALTGYGVDGWYNSSNTKVGTEGTKVNVSPGTTLVAKGIGNTYTLTYNYNGATGGNSTTSKAVTYNSTYGTLPSPTRSYVVTYNYNSATSGNTTANATSNYTFNGWYKESTFSNQVTSSIIYNTVGNSTIYAKWTGTSIVLPTPTKTGYTFSGWYSDSSFTNKVGDGESSYTPTSSLTLYAKWTDTTAPTCTLTVPSATIDVVAIKAACTDVSDVTNYKFSENGSTYIDKGTSTSYTMNSFSISKIRIQATDGNGNTGTYQINATNLNDGYTKIYNVLNTKYKSILSQKESYENTFLDKTHPVGSIYVSTTYSTTSQVSAALGGTWEVYGSGKTLVGVNTSDTNFNTVNKTGGSSTSTLAVMNMPSHTHSIPALSGTAASAGTHTHSIPSLSGTTASAGTHTHSLATWVFNGYNQSGGINKYGMKYQKTGKQEIRTGVNSALENSWGINNAGAHTHTITTNASTSGSNGAHTHSVAINASTTGTSGSGTSFTNLQPYITVYMYKRVK
ncbi:MAG: InlB B-repeat-containing protein, partial [Oscillospiraceae bacterium]